MGVKVAIIVGMIVVGIFNICLMKKIAPQDKLYPIWALFVEIVFALVILSI